MGITAVQRSAGAAIFCAAMVSMWQTVTIQARAKHDAAEHAERLRSEWAAAVNEAALMAIRVAEKLYVAVIDGDTTQLDPISPVQQLMQSRGAEVRRLAAELLRTGLDDTDHEQQRVVRSAD